MPITCTVQDRIAEIVFDVPPVNAFDSETWMSIPDIITNAARREDVNCVLIRAEGRGFQRPPLLQSLFLQWCQGPLILIRPVKSPVRTICFPACPCIEKD